MEVARSGLWAPEQSQMLISSVLSVFVILDGVCTWKQVSPVGDLETRTMLPLRLRSPVTAGNSSALLFGKSSLLSTESFFDLPYRALMDGRERSGSLVVGSV